MTIALWCVFIAGILPYVATIAAKAGLKNYDNNAPRSMQLEGYRAPVTKSDIALNLCLEATKTSKCRIPDGGRDLPFCECATWVSTTLKH